jgi:hypothetical protein
MCSISKVEALLHSTICKIAATFGAMAVRVQGVADLQLRMQCTTALDVAYLNDCNVTFLSIPLTVLDSRIWYQHGMHYDYSD